MSEENVEAVKPTIVAANRRDIDAVLEEADLSDYLDPNEALEAAWLSV